MREVLPSPSLLAALALTLACTGDQASQRPDPQPAPRAPILLTLVGTNDLHGWVYPQEFTLKDGTTASEGGVAAFAGYLSILRRQNPEGVLLLDGGDLFQGTLPSNLSEGRVVIEAMNHLGYTAVAVGNHEFDYGPVGPSPVALRDDQDPFGALKARIGEADFPLLAVNMVEAATLQVPVWLGNGGTVIVERNGVKVGIVGLITPHTPTVTNPVNVASLRFQSLEKAGAAAQALREQGAEVVIGVAHAGGKCADLSDPHDLSSCDKQDGEIFEMLEALPEGTLDALVAGHTHQPLGHFIRGTPVVETPGKGRYFGLIELSVDPESRKVLREKTRIIPMVPVCAQVEETLGTCEFRKLRGKEAPKLVPATFRGEPVVIDEALAAKLAPAKQAAEQLQQRPLGIDVPQRLVRNYEAEGPLGLLLADALREHEKADIAMLNPGGLRADLQAGPLTYGDVFEVIPFDNTVATVTLTGEQLMRLFEVAYGSRKGVFQISGARVQLARCPGPDRLKSLVLASGKPPLPEKTYRVVMPDFLARGGDGMGPVLRSLGPDAIDLGESREDNFRDAIVDFWSSRKVPLVAPEMGRVTFVEDGRDCPAADGER